MADRATVKTIIVDETAVVLRHMFRVDGLTVAEAERRVSLMSAHVAGTVRVSHGLAAYAATMTADEFRAEWHGQIRRVLRHMLAEMRPS